MTTLEIQKYIDLLNNKDGQELIFTRPLSEFVEIGKVWPGEPDINDTIKYTSSYTFFFLKNHSNIYVGAVLDMGSNLHWYIVPQHRKKALLTNALKKTILPYIFYDREEQRITITKSNLSEENYSNSKKVSELAGFKPVNNSETEFIAKEEDYNWNLESINAKDIGIETKRINVLKKRVNYASQILAKISDELLMKCGDDNDMLEISIEIKKHLNKIEDLASDLSDSK